MDWKAKNQKNKAIVWEYWQRINSAAPNEVKGIFQKTFHKYQGSGNRINHQDHLSI